MSRKIILNLAISVDGFIADPDGGYAWIAGDGDKTHDTDNQFDFSAFVESVDTIIMGRKSFLDVGDADFENYREKKIYVATTHELDTKLENVEVISGDLVSQIFKLKEQEGKDIWLFGGGQLVEYFIKADVVDEYIIGIIPIILGKGIPLFLHNNPTLELQLETCSVQEGMVMVTYTRRKKID